MKFLLASSLICAVNAFTLTHHTPIQQSSTRLHAADGPPKYDKMKATLRQAEAVGDGSVMLHIDTEDVIEYEPGHVIALEIPADDDSSTQDGEDSQTEWMRGPYTVSRSTDNSLDILIKTVGDKSHRFATAESGTPLQFGGKFKVPILEGISMETTKRVVFISTGVGVGPCVGAIEKALEQESFPQIDLLCSYRTEAEVIYKDHLTKLQKENPDNFTWKPIITSERGRLSASGDNLRTLTWFNAGLESTHYHLIGNGQMVSEFKAGLLKAGVPEDKITLEMYFNHKAEMDTDAADRIAAALMETAATSVIF